MYYIWLSIKMVLMLSFGVVGVTAMFISIVCVAAGESVLLSLSLLVGGILFLAICFWINDLN